jgi:hypothetical protein
LAGFKQGLGKNYRQWGFRKDDAYQLKFDSLNRIEGTKKIDNQLIETRSYFYDENAIQETVIRERKGKEKSIFHVRVTLDENGDVVERVNLNGHGEVSSTVIITYNENGTIWRIRKGNTVQRFEYINY